MGSSGMAQSVHQKLLNLRDKTGEQFNHLLMRYGLVRLLQRLVASGQGPPASAIGRPVPFQVLVVTDDRPPTLGYR